MFIIIRHKKFITIFRLLSLLFENFLILYLIDCVINLTLISLLCEISWYAKKSQRILKE